MEAHGAPRHRLALPDAGVTFDVECCSTAGDERRPHPVTITPDWQLITPHNLDAERIAVALGGVCSCVDLVDRGLPAIRGYVNHRLRLKPARIQHTENGSWIVTLDAVGCCTDQRFPQARDAAAHLRRPQHWARRYGTTDARVTELAQRVLDAVAADSGDAAVANQSFDLTCPDAPDVAAAIAEPYGLVALWDAGLHPDDVADLLADLAPDGGPTGMHDILAAAYGGSGDHRQRGRRRPDHREAWLRAGVPLAAVTTLLSGNHYSLNDARILAARLSRPLAEAAETLARWQGSGVTPPVDTIVGAYWGPTLTEVPPPRAQVDRTLALAREAGLDPTRVSAALALVRTGTPPAAVAMLADPSRRPDDPYSW